MAWRGKVGLGGAGPGKAWQGTDYIVREVMQIQNMLESNGKGAGYQAGNIRLVKILAAWIEITKRNGEVIKYQRVEVKDEVVSR